MPNGVMSFTQHMQLVQMIVQNDAAHAVANKLGQTGILEFRDVSVRYQPGLPLVLDGVSFAPQLRGEIGTPRAVLTQYSNPRPPGSARNPRARWARDRRYKLYDDGRLVDCVDDPDELEALDPGVAPGGVRTRLQAALDAMPPEPEHLREK